MVRFQLCFLTIFLAIANGQDYFHLANIFQDDMVLQMEPKNAQIWGFGEAHARVAVYYDNTSIVTFVKADGTWVVSLRPHAAGPVDFEILYYGSSQYTKTLSVWFGDVWVCSGHRNMEMKLSEILNASEETTKALSYTNLRLLRVNKNYKVDAELSEVNSFAHGWSAPSADNVPHFSALCLLYGERMSESFGNTRHIGLIDSTWNGQARIESWVSKRVPNHCRTPAYNSSGANSESALWNAMIAPLTKTAVRGAIWYQGESNVGWNPEFYSCHIAAMAQDWRQTFVDGDVPDENGIAFPFGVVQIGPVGNDDNYTWGALRMHQTGDQGVLPNPLMPEAFFSTAYDLTDLGQPFGDIRPRDKQTVAERLANAAKNLLYGENFSRNGPTPIGATEDLPGQITITYDSNIRIGGPTGFAVEKADGTWSPVLITASTSNTVTVGVDAGDATFLTLGYRATVCDYKECPVYSDDAENLPAQVWKWDLAAIRQH